MFKRRKCRKASTRNNNDKPNEWNYEWKTTLFFSSSSVERFRVLIEFIQLIGAHAYTIFLTQNYAYNYLIRLQSYQIDSLLSYRYLFRRNRIVISIYCCKTILFRHERVCMCVYVYLLERVSVGICYAWNFIYRRNKNTLFT